MTLFEDILIFLHVHVNRINKRDWSQNEASPFQFSCLKYEFKQLFQNTFASQNHLDRENQSLKCDELVYRV